MRRLCSRSSAVDTGRLLAAYGRLPFVAALAIYSVTLSALLFAIVDRVGDWLDRR
jgi:hypothetical protein